MFQVKELASEDIGGAYIRPKAAGHKYYQSKTLTDVDVDLKSALDFLHDVGAIVVCNMAGDSAVNFTGFPPPSPDVSSFADVRFNSPIIILRPEWLAMVLCSLLHPSLTTALLKTWNEPTSDEVCTKLIDSKGGS